MVVESIVNMVWDDPKLPEDSGESQAIPIHFYYLSILTIHNVEGSVLNWL